MIIALKVIGFKNGHFTFQNICQPEAPSTRAASVMLSGIARNPARYIAIVYPDNCQTAAMITGTRARLNGPIVSVTVNQPHCRLFNPTCPNSTLTPAGSFGRIPGAKNHRQTVPVTTRDRAIGKRKMLWKMRPPFKFRSRRAAKINPIKRQPKRKKTVKNRVFHISVWKRQSAKRRS